jgi:membrane protein
MDSFAKRGNEPAIRFSVSDPNRGRKFAFTRYFDSFSLSPLTLWMSLAAVLGWVLQSLLLKRRPAYQPGGQKEMGYRSEKAGSFRQVNKKGPTILSIGIELFLAVGANVLKRYVKAWSSEIIAGRKGLASEEASSLEPSPEIDPTMEALSDKAERKEHPAQGTSKEVVWFLLKTTATQWMNDKCPQLGAALAYFTVFSLAPLVLILLAFFGLFFGSEHARDKIIEQLQYLIDPSGIKVIQDIATSASKPQSGILATALGVVVGLFGASGVFGQLQDALNTIWGVKAKPGAGLWTFVRARFLSFAMVAGVCFLLLVSLTVESVLRGLSSYLQNLVPGGHILALVLFLILDIGVVIVLFAMIFRFLPDIKIGWRDVWVGASITGILFVAGKFILGLYLGSGAAGSAYGAASSLITLLLWIYYSAQILLFGAEFTQVYTHIYGSRVEPEEHAVRVKRVEVEVPNPER